MSLSCKTMSYFSLTLPNRPGELAHFTAQLRDAGINLLGLWGNEAEAGRTRIACVPESAAAFRRFFNDSGISLEEGATFFLSDTTTAGSLVATLRTIADANINIESVECVTVGARFGCFVWTDPAQTAALEDLLQKLQR